MNELITLPRWIFLFLLMLSLFGTWKIGDKVCELLEGKKKGGR
jgi:hypothetical protein